MSATSLAERENLRCGVFIPPWSLPLALSPTTAIRREIDFVEFLDRVGYDEAWIGEHHSGGMEIISSPELFIAAAAERTSRIRLGPGVISLPFHNPLITAVSLGTVTAFTENMTAGRGWVAVATVMLAARRPVGVLAACLLFGAAEAWGFRLQGLGLPQQLTDAAPYLVTLVVLLLVRLRRRRGALSVTAS